LDQVRERISGAKPIDEKAPCEHLKPESRRLGAHELLYDLVSHFLVRGLTASVGDLQAHAPIATGRKLPLGGS
jgi:hypothetical protein